MGLKRTTAGGREAASLAKRSRPIRNPPIFDGDTGRDVSPNLEPEDYTIAWICALHLELAASLALLDEQHPPLPSHPGDDNNYVLGRIQHHNVVMVCLPGQYGTNNAAIVATNLKRSFPNIRATLMVGVGGGAPAEADLRLGDVVVGTRVMQYDMGKVVTDGSFLRTALPKLPAPFLNSAVCTLRSKHAEEDRTGYSNRVVTLLRSRFPSLALPSQADRLFQASYDHVEGAPNCDGCDPARLQSRSVRLSDEPMIQYGVIASGNELLRNSKRRDMISSELGAICFEMEAAGMMDNLQCLPIRGICDYSDSHKNKISQDYAAATAACYARELLELIPPIHGSVGVPAHATRAGNPGSSGDSFRVPSTFA
jgi:nucleoside phosphorylase